MNRQCEFNPEENVRYETDVNPPNLKPGSVPYWVDQLQVPKEHIYDHYRPLTKLREGNNFSRVCPSVKGECPCTGLGSRACVAGPSLIF